MKHQVTLLVNRFRFCCLSEDYNLRTSDPQKQTVLLQKELCLAVLDRCNHSRVTRFHCSCRKNFVLRSWTVAITLVLHGYKPRRPWAGTNALCTTRCRQICPVLRICPASRSFPSCPDRVSRSFPSCPASRSFPSCSVCHAPSRPALRHAPSRPALCVTLLPVSFPSCSVCHAPSRPALTVRHAPSRPALCVTLLPVLPCVSRSFPSCPDCVTLLPVLP